MKFKIPTSKQIREFFFNLPFIVTLLTWSKAHSLPGFAGVPLYDVVVFILNELKRHALITRANSIAFSFFLSFFPAVIFLFTLVPYILPYFDYLIIPYLPEEQIIRLADGSVAFTKTLVEVVRFNVGEIEILPFTVRGQLVRIIETLAIEQRPGQLYFVLILTLFFSSNGLMTLFKGFEKSHPTTFKRRTLVRKRLVAIFLTFLIGLILLLGFLVISLSSGSINSIIHFLNLSQFSGIIISSLSWLSILSLFYFGIAIIYRYGAATFRRFSWFSPGATLASFFSILSLLAFSFYVDNFSSYDTLYGPLGSIIVVMLWIQINAFILLIGFELNASIAINRDLKIAKDED